MIKIVNLGDSLTQKQQEWLCRKLNNVQEISCVPFQVTGDKLLLGTKQESGHTNTFDYSLEHYRYYLPSL